MNQILPLIGRDKALLLQDVNNNGHKTFRHGSIECWRPDKLTSDCLYEQLL